MIPLSNSNSFIFIYYHFIVSDIFLLNNIQGLRNSSLGQITSTLFFNDLRRIRLL